jgi:transcriptional antiterminator RfaH
VPLFNSYVFVQLEEKDRNLVFQSAGAVRYLFWLGKAAIVRDQEIDTIKNWLSTPDKCDVSIEAYQIGDKITLESGPFIAQEATVQEIKNTHYVLVLESMGCTLKMNFK